MVGKAQKSHRARSRLHGGCSSGVPPISVSASIATFQSHNADAPLSLFRHPKKGSLKTTVTPFSRSRRSVLRSASLAKGDTSKKRPSPHLHKVPTRSNELNPRTLQTAPPPRVCVCVCVCVCTYVRMYTQNALFAYPIALVHLLQIQNFLFFHVYDKSMKPGDSQ
jgi:hypothetical protein